VTQHYSSGGDTEVTTILSETRRVQFSVRDATGSILVDPRDARIEPEEVVNKFEKGLLTTIPALQRAKEAAEWAGSKAAAADGYKYVEKIIPVDAAICVIGEAADTSGKLTIQTPEKKGTPFIITLKSREELTRRLKRSIKNSTIAVIVLWIAGPVLIAAEYILNPGKKH
jgi:hypothetical protein